MSDDCVKHYELEWLQEQIYELQDAIRELQMENNLLRNDLNTIKNEGCWRYIEQPTHSHKTTCSKCGMVWEGVMGYVCGNVDCPVQLKVT
jgi:hypothetical protein